jgi:hypothetical protein
LLLNYAFVFVVLCVLFFNFACDKIGLSTTEIDLTWPLLMKKNLHLTSKINRKGINSVHLSYMKANNDVGRK